jgi:hypothetical protein
VRRVLTGLVVALLLLPVWDAAISARRNHELWSRLRARGRVPPDTGWDRAYRAHVAYLPTARRWDCSWCIVAFTLHRANGSGSRGLRDLGPVLVGAAPALVAIAIFKVGFAPPSYFTAEQSLGEAIASLLDPDRMALVGRSVARELWLTGATIVGVLPILAAFAVVRGIDRQAPAAARFAVPAIGVLLTVYVVAYLVTPKDLAWQLRTSVDRVVLQLVPTLA